jgi:hypothetical protein
VSENEKESEMKKGRDEKRKEMAIYYVCSISYS